MLLGPHRWICCVVQPELSQRSNFWHRQTTLESWESCLCVRIEILCYLSFLNAKYTTYLIIILEFLNQFEIVDVLGLFMSEIGFQTPKIRIRTYSDFPIKSCMPISNSLDIYIHVVSFGIKQDLSTQPVFNNLLRSILSCLIYFQDLLFRLLIYIIYQSKGFNRCVNMQLT